MNYNEIPHTKSVTLRPSVMQWTITFLPHIIIATAGVLYAGMEDMPLTNVALVVSLVLVLFLLYQLAYLRSIKYHVSSQQLITSFGVFHLERNYMELYRVVDFYEHQSLMQRLVGLKSVTLYSTDRNTPQLFIIGIKNNLDVVGYLRPLVLYIRKRMGIHEFCSV